MAHQDKINSSKDFLTPIFFAVLITLYSLCLLLPFNAGIQERVMAKFHLANKSFVAWAPWQFVPSMYSFKNEISIGQTENFIVNHYPLRVVSFNLNFRDTLLKNGSPQKAILSSHYRGRSVTTEYQIIPDNRALMVERLP